MLLYSARAGLVWNGVFLTLALLANFLFHFEGELAPGPRGLMVAVGFILACILSAGIATVRRDREKIHHLMSQLAEANTLLQESRKQAENLAAEQERKRITRELNYSLGHKMTVAIVQLEGAVLLLDKDPGRVAASLNTVHGPAQERAQRSAPASQSRYEGRGYIQPLAARVTCAHRFRLRCPCL